MTMFGSQWLANLANQGGGYTIDQSIRFNDDDSAYLNWSPSGAGTSRDVMTFSFWFKLASDSTTRVFTQGVDGNNYTWIGFGGSESSSWIRIQHIDGGAVTWATQADASFRDFSAWTHALFVIDTTEGTAADRVKIYINGTLMAHDGSSTYPASGVDVDFGSSDPFYVGRSASAYGYYDGYLAEVHYIDGTALTPSSFGETNSDGVWVPIEYTGSYGTNGFYITGATASDLGEDFSGNGNDFTSNGLATTDQMLDTPTSNYCTLSPVNSGSTLSLGNLKAITTAGVSNSVGTIGVSSGKWYFEYTQNAGSNILMGISSDASQPLVNYLHTAGYEAYLYYSIDGNKYLNGTASSYGAIWGAGDVIGVAIDYDADTLTFYKNNASQGTALTGLPSVSYPCHDGNSTASVGGTFNFGATAFTYTPPTDHLAIATQNLPTPAITDGSAHFQPTLYTGTGSSLAVTQSGNSTFQPDFVWIKGRSGATEHVLTDAVRGVTKELSSNDTGTEETVAQGLTAFGSSGFTVGTDGSYNTSSATYVGWQWKANGAGSSNTDGSLSSTVSANQTAGFSIVTATPGTSGTDTIGHGLGIAPKMILGKNLSLADNWYVYHDAISPAQSISLNTTGAATTTRYNSATTSSVFQIVNGTWTNGGQVCLWYCFAEIPGYSSFGSYTGNGSTDGPFLYCGFRPAFVMAKRTDSTSNWPMWDTARDTFNVANKDLASDVANAEPVNIVSIDILSNGFKLRITGNPNVSGGAYMYMAFAEHPFGGVGVAPATAR